MKKKIIVIILFVLCLLIAGGAWVYCCYSPKTNPWNAKTVGDIPVPKGFSRVEAKSGSYADYLRSLPLKERGTEIKLFTGGKPNLRWLGAAVIDNRLLSNDEQCADVTMRLRAEYLWQKGRYSEICFYDVNKKEMRYTGGNSRKAFEKYMRRVYGRCSTYSVFHETRPCSINDVQAGDVFVYTARSGHKYGYAIIVVDVAKNESGKVAVMCAEGNTPARSQHIVRSFNPFRNPWFVFDENDEIFYMGPFHFYKNELRRY